MRWRSRLVQIVNRVRGRTRCAPRISFEFSFFCGLEGYASGLRPSAARSTPYGSPSSPSPYCGYQFEVILLYDKVMMR